MSTIGYNSPWMRGGEATRQRLGALVGRLAAASIVAVRPIVRIGQRDVNRLAGEIGNTLLGQEAVAVADTRITRAGPFARVAAIHHQPAARMGEAAVLEVVFSPFMRVARRDSRLRLFVARRGAAGDRCIRRQAGSGSIRRALTQVRSAVGEQSTSAYATLAHRRAGQGGSVPPNIPTDGQVYGGNPGV